MSLEALYKYQVAMDGLEETEMVETSIGIDKLCIRYDYGGSPEAESEFIQLQEFKGSVKDGLLGVQGKFWKASKAAITSMKLPLPSGAALIVKYGYVHGRFWAWIEFNPSRLTNDDQCLVSTSMDLLFTHGMSTLWKRARIARLDIAVDAKPVSFGSYLFLDKRLKASQHQYDMVGSTYLGSVDGQKTILAYDKTKERWDKAKMTVDQPWLRVEARLFDPKRWALHEIPDIVNPFSTLLVVDRHELLAIDCKVLKPIRFMVASGESLDKAYWNLPAAARGEIWKRLQSISADWWDPQAVWQKYSSALAWVPQLVGPVVQSIAKVVEGGGFAET